MSSIGQFSISNSINAFAIDLYIQLKETDQNLFISPLSIFTALTMIFMGAKNETEEQLKNRLHITLNKTKVPIKIRELVDKLLKIKNIEVTIANSIWADNNYEILESFLYLMEENYNGAFYKENFENIENTCNKINIWVKKNTYNKIKTIISPQKFDPTIKLILLNVIYFKGIWDISFNKNLTQETNFYLQNREIAPVLLMHQINVFPYFENKDLQILELPYKGNQRYGKIERYSMFIFLPTDKYRLKNLEKKISVDFLFTHLEQLYKQEVDIYIPKFKMETKYELKKDLKKLGLTLPFTTVADFSGIIDISKNLFLNIGEILHKAFVDVNEKGTEAAAVTMITKRGKGPLPQRKIPIFKADHAFIFLIVDSQTKTIIFIGKLISP